MSTVLKSFYHNLKEPIIICDFLTPESQKNGEKSPENSKNLENNIENLNGVYFNKAFQNIFSDVDPKMGARALKKLDYKFYFEFCLLESENLKTYSPLKDAITSKKNFTLYGMYQKNEKEYLYFLIQAFSLKKYRILYFYDITEERMLERLSSENEKLKIQNREFLNTNSKAQNQAVKMALLNRISTNISKTIDINDLLNTALNELNIIFGAKKSYFAKRLKSKEREEFEVEHTYPENKPFLGEILRYDKQTTDDILDNKISIQTCLMEYENAAEPLNSPCTRIILPISNKENVLAVVVILTTKKNIEEIEKELLLGVSMQISGAITQAMLFKAVSDKKEELEGALSELKETQLQLINSEKMASLGQLIASVAHEINTPLASICANNEIAKRFYDTNETFDKDIVEILKDTNDIDKDAIGRITNLVQSLKRFVRLDEMTSQAANINEELDLTLNLLRHKLKKDIKLTKNYGEIPLVECYPNMLNQVFLNILMNSIQSIEKEASVENAGLSGTALQDGACAGGVRYAGEIIISTEIVNDKLSVKIEDNGFGIKEEDKKKIFQAGFTTKKVGEGTGLGLAICKKIIEKHKGEIRFDSTSYRVKNSAAEGGVSAGASPGASSSTSFKAGSRVVKSTVFEILLPL